MIVVIILLTLGFTPPVATQPWQICGDTVVNYTTSSGSRHDANLELLSTKLINKATTNPYHFATDSAGAAPDTIYGLALCRGDMNATACRACIATACRGAQRLCPYRDDATVFYPTCRLRFSSKNFLHPDDYSQIVDGVVNTMNTMDTTNTEPVLPGWDPSNAESAEAITEIIRVLLQETARQAAYSSGAWMFATGRMDAGTGSGSFPALYSMAQCVPALTHRDCSSCLQVISFMATDNFAGRQGGRLLALWCNLRYDTVYFYRGDPMVTIVSPVKEVVPPGPLVVPSRKHFGLARIFSTNNTEVNTERIVGTYGYMAPEYASEGLFSIKSDVFSFGVLTLEIVSGKRSSGFHQYGDFINLLGHAWQLWKGKKWLQIVDASLVIECHTLEIMRCINVALLCVQENAADRPTMSDVVVMLSSESMTLPEPKHPAYFHIRVTAEETSIVTETSTVNDTTMSALCGR
ncbi:hypothetical protein QOZ80_9BG0715700 [Eleusine coracana subsp. coracana]|nr:hypothetical protein QOZ80_9BG0715700 [Eleusine coracana subsp. coracana]